MIRFQPGTGSVKRAVGGMRPGHELPTTLRAPFIHSLIVDEWETTNPMIRFQPGADRVKRAVGATVVSPAL